MLYAHAPETKDVSSQTTGSTPKSPQRPEGIELLTEGVDFILIYGCCFFQSEASFVKACLPPPSQGKKEKMQFNSAFCRMEKSQRNS